MAAVAAPQGSNTYIPSLESSGYLFVNYSRNPDSFAVNKYTQIVPVTKQVGRYTEMTIEQAGRILNTDAREDIWKDGEDEPSDRGDSENFAFKPYTTIRYRKGYRVGHLAAEQASWDLLGNEGKIKAQQAMTRRSQLAATLLTTSGNYAAANTSAVSSISGNTGKWDVSTSARLDIKRSFRYGVNIIRQNTLGAVNIKDLMVVMSPTCAGLMSESQEIVDLIKQSPDALAYIKGNLGPNAAYGLPDRLYGLPIVLEDAVKTTNKKGATKATGYVWGDTVAAIVSRPGALNGSNGDKNEGMDSNESPSFASCTCFVKEDMAVQTFDDVNNRVHRGRIVDDFSYVGTALMAAFLFTATTG
jgi:hypothetical protein